MTSLFWKVWWQNMDSIWNLLNDFDKKLKVIKWADQDLEIGIDLTAKL